MQKMASNMQKIASNMQNIANNMQKIASKMQKIANNMQKINHNMQKKAYNVQKTPLQYAENSSQLQRRYVRSNTLHTHTRESYIHSNPLTGGYVPMS